MVSFIQFISILYYSALPGLFHTKPPLLSANAGMVVFIFIQTCQVFKTCQVFLMQSPTITCQSGHGGICLQMYQAFSLKLTKARNYFGTVML